MSLLSVSLLLSMLFFSLSAEAQVDSIAFSVGIDTILLDQQRWQQSRNNHHSKHLSEQDLQVYNNRTLSEVLDQQSSFFVKNYGISGISTLSGRGGSAQQTAVLWEGFDLQNPMLGQVDVSLISINFVDYVDIQYGGETALFGSGSIGGSIHLGTHALFNKGWSFKGQLQGGSFENFSQQFNIGYSNRHYSFSMRSNYLSAKNNFPYIDINAFGFPKPIKRQQNAAVEQLGLMQEHQFRFKQHRAGLKLWFQHADRYIPPTLLNNSSEDRQLDWSMRSMAYWTLLKEQMVWKVKTAFFAESIHFTNTLVNSFSLVYSSITDAQNKWYINEQHQLLTALHFRYSVAAADGYSSTPSQWRTALLAAYNWTDKSNRWSTHIRIRQEVVDAQLLYPAASIGLGWHFFQACKLELQVSNNYRLPTFNDLYWNVLGNPQLRPEYAWNTALNATMPFSFKKSKLSIDLGIFSNWVHDWILWTPNDIGLWRPENVAQVWAYGLETDLEWQYKSNAWTFSCAGNYAFTKSIRTASDKVENIGKQLIYTPVHQANVQLSLQYKNTRLSYQQQVISERFIDNLNEESLPLYHLGSLRLEQSLKLKDASTALFAHINNLYGSDYQVVSMRPMPWQQFEVGIRLGINH